MADKQQRTGLVSYGGDSDSEVDQDNENTSLSSTPPYAIPFMVNSLGIPPSKPNPPSSPPSFVKPVVHSAPLGGLVASYGDDDHNETREMDAFLNDEVFPSMESSETEELTKSEDLVDPEQPLSENDTEPEVEMVDPSQDNESYSPPNSVPLFLPLNNVHLPPEPSTRCSNALQEKVKALLQKQAVLGIDLNKSIQDRKDFRNPSIYKKLLDFCNLDEFGTNYPEHLYNPHEWQEEDYHDNLLKAQRKAYEKKERAKQERGKVEFVTGTKRPITGLLGAAPGRVDVVKKQRRTKWDLETGSGVESGGSRGTSPTTIKGPLLGNAPIKLGSAPVQLGSAPVQLGSAPVQLGSTVQLGSVGPQAKAQANILNTDLTRTK